MSPPSAYRCHRPGRHPGGREGGGEELRQLPRHAGGLHGHGRAAGDGLPAVQGAAGTAGGGTARAVAQRGVPLTVPNPAVCQRAEPVAVSPAQGVRQQPPRAPLLPPRRLPRRQVELLPPARQDRYGEVAPEPRGGAGVSPRYGDRAAPQGWDATGPGTASPCRTGVTRWTPRWRLSGSSSTCRACGGRSGEPLAAGAPHRPRSRAAPATAGPSPLSAGTSTGSCWSRRRPGTAPAVKVGWGAGFGDVLLGRRPRRSQGVWG